MTLRDLVPSFGKKKIPVRYNSDPFRMLQEDMNRLFDDFFRGFDIEPFGKRLGTFSPDIEVSENEKEIRVAVELPGMDENDIDISLTDDELTISGEKKEERESREEDYYMRERTYGSFKRTIPIYAEINPDKAEAHFKKGVLTIVLPKTAKEKEKKKKIDIKVE